MFMRVALGIHGDDILAALETYWLMSHRLMVRNSHPVQRGDGRPRCPAATWWTCSRTPSTASDTLKGARTSKYARGIGLSVSSVRARGAPSRANGASDGIVPWRRCSATPRAGSTRAGRGASLCIWNRGMLISCRSWTSGGTAAPAKSPPLPRALGSGPVHATRGERRRLEPLCPNEAPG
jgi:hypothetical protein